MDYPHAQVIIEPRESWDAPFEYDLSGLTLCAQAPAFELVTIDDVTAESPADAAGLKLGDIVRSVDGRLVSGASLEWIAERLTVPEARYAFRVERNGELGELVDLELKLGTATFLDVR
jgi:S1-C subfamily serine protease